MCVWICFLGDFGLRLSVRIFRKDNFLDDWIVVRFNVFIKNILFSIKYVLFDIKLEKKEYLLNI